jgi:hypothetical protein
MSTDHGSLTTASPYPEDAAESFLLLVARIDAFGSIRLRRSFALPWLRPTLAAPYPGFALPWLRPTRASPYPGFALPGFRPTRASPYPGFALRSLDGRFPDAESSAKRAGVTSGSTTWR